MSKKSLIDIHTHVLPIDNERVLLDFLRICFKERYDNINQFHTQNTSFTEQDLINQLRNGEIDKAVVMSTDHEGMRLNDFVFELAQKYDGLIIPSVSVDPTSDNAVKKLEYQFNRLCMNFDEYKPILKFYPHRWTTSPSDVNLDYYRVVRDFEGIIIAHTGAHHTLSTKDNSKTNPLFWETALNQVQGLVVVASHCGTPSQEYTSYEEEAIRMAEDHENFFIDFSGLQSILPSGNYYELSRRAFDLAIQSIQRGTGLEKKIVGGSDYPICPDINRTRYEQIALLNRIFDPYENTEKLIARS
ncbi:hypothetical protein CEE44_00720 [Candidatus Woesearchaeota archaeon B3_Woes]|nr:MAG: hypothetical protein CEE44_00720 [Candidatus Woesearchaeota archaeon B3_Woes]